MARFRFLPLLAAAQLLAGACSAETIESLRFVALDGSLIGLTRQRAKEPANVDSGGEAVFVLARPAAIPAAADLSVSAVGEGTLDVRALSSVKNGRILASAAFELAKGMANELRLPLIEGSSVGAVSITADRGATVSAIGLKPALSGMAFDGSSLAFDASTVVGFGDHAGFPVSVRAKAGAAVGSSLVIKLRSDGVAAIRAVRDGSVVKSFEARIRPGRALAIPLSSFGKADVFEVSARAGIAGVTLEGGDGFPLSDLYAALEAPPPSGDYAAYSWDVLPATILLDFRDYDAQDRYLKRLAFFAEKPGFRGRLAADAEMAGLHGWNAHDYSAETLARFFSLAEAEGFALSREEAELRRMLIGRGVVRASDGRFAAGEGALISVSRESGRQLRRLFADHEASHALLFQDRRYEALAAELWRSLDAEGAWFWKTHFEWREYDVSDEFLCLNELQSYLVQQSVGATYGYYENLAARLGKAYPGRKERLEAGAARFATEAAEMSGRLSSYLEEEYGLAAGAFGRARSTGASGD